MDASHDIARDHSTGHRSTHDKRSEDRVQADKVGEPGAERHEGEPYDEPCLGKRAISYQPSLRPKEERPDEQQCEDYIGGAGTDVHHRLGPAQGGVDGRLDPRIGAPEARIPHPDLVVER